MDTITASAARIPPEIFNRVAYAGERVEIRRRGGKSVWLVCERDLKRLEGEEGAVGKQGAKGESL